MEERKSSDALHKIGVFLLAAVPILVLLPPLIGFSFNLGYLSIFGLDANVFPRSPVELWQYSYIVSLQWLSALIKPYTQVLIYWFIALIFVSLIVLTLATLRALGKLPVSKKKCEALFGKKTLLGRIDTFIESCEKLYDEIKGLWHIFLAVLTLPFIFHFLLAQPFNTGKELGQRALDFYNQSGCTKNSISNWAFCVSYSNPNNPDSKLYHGLLVAASSTHLAILGGGNLSVIPRNMDYVLTRTYKGKEDESHR